MRILVIGSGLMGPAAAYNAMSDPDVAQVTLCDARQDQLDVAVHKLARLPGSDKLRAAVLDLADSEAARRLMAGFDVVLTALPKLVVPLGIRAAAAAGLPQVDLTWPVDEEVPALRAEVEAAGNLLIPGCGVEPGLTEILARFAVEQMDRVDELHIKCGGIPEVPAPPLGYKIVFGGRQLPLRDMDARLVENGELKTVPRFSGVEPVSVPGVGECEAWHEGFMPWLLDLEPLKGLKLGTQKTIRWPGYAAKINVLKEMGLLSPEPVEVDGVPVAPKKLVDAVLYPHVRLEEGERDLTVLRVEALGAAAGFARRYRIDMVDRYDDELGFTSMARTTAFTGAIVARMVARGDIRARGWLSPEKLIAGPLLDRLLRELREQNVRFTLTTERVEAL